MQIPKTTLAIFAIVAAAAGIIGVTVFLAESADAWHSLFASKKLCVDFMKQTGNTTSQAQFMCNKVIPH